MVTLSHRKGLYFIQLITHPGTRVAFDGDIRAIGWLLSFWSNGYLVMPIRRMGSHRSSSRTSCTADNSNHRVGCCWYNSNSKRPMVNETSRASWTFGSTLLGLQLLLLIDLKHQETLEQPKVRPEDSNHRLSNFREHKRTLKIYVWADQWPPQLDYDPLNVYLFTEGPSNPMPFPRRTAGFVCLLHLPGQQSRLVPSSLGGG